MKLALVGSPCHFTAGLQSREHGNSLGTHNVVGFGRLKFSDSFREFVHAYPWVHRHELPRRFQCAKQDHLAFRCPGGFKTLDLSRFGYARIASGQPLRERNVI